MQIIRNIIDCTPSGLGGQTHRITTIHWYTQLHKITQQIIDNPTKLHPLVHQLMFKHKQQCKQLQSIIHYIIKHNKIIPTLDSYTPPPPYLFPLKTTFSTIHLLSKRPEIYQMLAKSCSLFIYYQKARSGGPGLY